MNTKTTHKYTHAFSTDLFRAVKVEGCIGAVGVVMAHTIELTLFSKTQLLLKTLLQKVTLA